MASRQVKRMNRLSTKLLTPRVHPWIHLTIATLGSLGNCNADRAGL